MMNPERLFLFVLLICAQGSSVAGLPSQGESYDEIRATKRVEALRIEEPVVIDGRLDETVWQRAQPADEFYQQSPDEGELATRQTEVRFLYDDTTLYVGAMMYDDQPEGLVINELRRDFGGSQNDTFGLVLDLFRDGQTGFGFLVNAGGATRDTQVYDNGQNDGSWHGVWFSRTANPGRWLERGIRHPLQDTPISESGSVGVGDEHGSLVASHQRDVALVTGLETPSDTTPSPRRAF